MSHSRCQSWDTARRCGVKLFLLRAPFALSTIVQRGRKQRRHDEKKQRHDEMVAVKARQKNPIKNT